MNLFDQVALILIKNWEFTRVEITTFGCEKGFCPLRFNQARAESGGGAPVCGRRCALLAQSGHFTLHCTCLLSGVKRTDVGLLQKAKTDSSIALTFAGLSFLSLGMASVHQPIPRF